MIIYDQSITKIYFKNNMITKLSLFQNIEFKIDQMLNKYSILKFYIFIHFQKQSIVFSIDIKGKL